MKISIKAAEEAKIRTLDETVEEISLLYSSTQWQHPSLIYPPGWKHPGKLPPGWEVRIDGYGRLYFANYKNRTTQWNHPAIMFPPGWEERTW